MATLVHDRSELEALFVELAAELDRIGVAAEIVMVGGAWMLWHTQRAATRDVDSARRLPAELGDAIATIAEHHDLGDGWLNDHATPFWPMTADYADCDVVFEAGGLRVLVPPARVVFLMKLYRGSPQDVEDMIQLWPMAGFTDGAEAAAAFALAYPVAPEDPFLGNFVDDHIIRHAH